MLQRNPVNEDDRLTGHRFGFIIYPLMISGCLIKKKEGFLQWLQKHRHISVYIVLIALQTLLSNTLVLPLCWLQDVTGDSNVQRTDSRSVTEIMVRLWTIAATEDEASGALPANANYQTQWLLFIFGKASLLHNLQQLAFQNVTSLLRKHLHSLIMKKKVFQQTLPMKTD